MKDYVREGGQWCIGTDSHISLNPMAEFRMMDYRQRLVSHRRNTFDGDAAQYMVHTAFRQGKFAMGIQHSKHFAPGQPLDAVVYDGDAPLIAKSNTSNRLATLLYTSDASGITGTMVSGKWVVKNNQHISAATIRENFLSALKDLR
jgi:formimidoylglutamate deiminase